MVGSSKIKSLYYGFFLLPKRKPLTRCARPRRLTRYPMIVPTSHTPNPRQTGVVVHHPLLQGREAKNSIASSTSFQARHKCFCLFTFTSSTSSLNRLPPTFTHQMHVCKELYFHYLFAFAFAGVASAAIYIKGKVFGLKAAHLTQRLFGERLRISS